MECFAFTLLYFLSIVADETSPTISLKSKLGVNFMVSFARKGDASENPLAKLLQATQDVIDKESDAAETAEFELGLWFPEGLNEWPQDSQSWVYE